ncbi:hypothetical protein [Fimbriiglobus ruber]|uniref:Uncharacterized protein n=1 Tax=Fimbriiglobus ruber TaxID=1908690 RepID=A0A225E8Z8_9BACT|nr:hypothetical protein [Fimbriiglobus ruber]OWK47228.1 hypothetical protein FRUB_00927 [Fimbriiglobus ruber]
MKQLYSTGTLNAGSVTFGAVGYSPLTTSAMRATSAGVEADELQTALSFANYTAPPSNGEANGRPLPVRLALLNTSSGRVLTHVTPNGVSYFAHTLLNVPTTADAQLAIQTWGSPLWQKNEPDSAADLPELPYLPVADVLDDDALRGWLDTPARRDLLEFALTALLGTSPTTRIILAAAADDVAKVVYAVTRALPQGLLDDFTFSTYEAEPLACTARLIGHDTGSVDRDLPAECYSGIGTVGFNPATGRRTEIPTDVPFAAFAVAALATGEYGPLDEVKGQWQRLGLKEPRQFDLVYRLARGTGVLNKEEAAAALQHPPLAAWISTRADALNQFLEWALEDRGFANTSFTRAVQALRQKPDVIGKLGQTVKDLGLKALRAGDKTRTANALEVILPMAAPSKANAVWGELITQLTTPDSLSWDMRWYLLPKFVRFKQQQGTTGVDPALAKWLDVPAEHLTEILALELPRAYHIAAGRACLGRDGEPSAVLTKTLAQHSTLALTLLQPAPTDADALRQVKLFDSLLAEAPAHPWFEDLLARATDYPAVLLNKFFEATLTAGKVDADRVIRTQGPRLLELFTGQTGLDRVGTQFLANPPADLLRNPGLLAFLDKLRDEPRVGDELKGRVAAVKAVRAYLDAPAFTADAMKPAADALVLTPPVVPPGTKHEVFSAVATALLSRANADTLQTDLEAALVSFGSALANDPSDLYENLLRDLRSRTEFSRQTNLVHTFLAVALGAAKAPELVGKLDGLDGHAFAIAAEAAKRGGNRVLGEIDRRSEAWPKAARTQWGFLLAAVRPRGARGVLRDAALILGGAGAATVVWWVVKLVG